MSKANKKILASVTLVAATVGALTAVISLILLTGRLYDGDLAETPVRALHPAVALLTCVLFLVHHKHYSASRYSDNGEMWLLAALSFMANASVVSLIGGADLGSIMGQIMFAASAAGFFGYAILSLNGLFGLNSRLLTVAGQVLVGLTATIMAIQAGGYFHFLTTYPDSGFTLEIMDDLPPIIMSAAVGVAAICYAQLKHMGEKEERIADEGERIAPHFTEYLKRKEETEAEKWDRYEKIVEELTELKRQYLAGELESKEYADKRWEIIEKI